ncbi:MAG: phosphotransferase [Fimbriimonadaceae bacterium]|nr:phosphotransferase [Fimbriimonadaceae bacterium]
MTDADRGLLAKAEALASEWAPGSRVQQTRRLRGGISAQMFALDLALADGARTTVVARFPNPELVRYFSDPVQQEFLTLSRVTEAGIPAPKPLAANHELLLLEYLSGTSTAAPQDVESFVDQMAEVLATIHDTDLGSGQFDFLLETRFAFRPPGRTPNLDLRESDVIEAAVSRAPRTPWRPVLRHGDFWPGNLLWTDGQLTGVVDWENALRGPALADLSITRLDIRWVLGRRAAERFTDRYLKMRPLDLTDLTYWDLRAALRPMENLEEWAGAYAALGRPDVTYEHMRDVLLEFIDEALTA